MPIPFIRPLVVVTGTHDNVWIDRERVIVSNDDGLNKAIYSFCEVNGQTSCIPFTKLPDDHYPCMLKLNLVHTVSLMVGLTIVSLGGLEQKGLSVSEILNNLRMYKEEEIKPEETTEVFTEYRPVGLWLKDMDKEYSSCQHEEVSTLVSEQSFNYKCLNCSRVWEIDRRSGNVNVR